MSFLTLFTAERVVDIIQSFLCVYGVGGGFEPINILRVSWFFNIDFVLLQI